MQKQTVNAQRGSAALLYETGTLVERERREGIGCQWPRRFPCGAVLEAWQALFDSSRDCGFWGRAEPVLLRKGFMRTRILLGPGRLWLALRHVGWQAHGSQTGTVVALGEQVLPAVSLGSRFTALAVGSLFTARRKRFVSQQTSCSPRLLLAASQDEGQET
jgi:hypothetical protein